MKLDTFLKAVKLKVTDSFNHQWDCYGPDALSIIRETKRGYNYTHSASCVFDGKTQLLLEVALWNYKKRIVSRWIKKSFINKYKEECEKRSVSFTNASDDMDYVDCSFEEIINLIDKAMK
jgi:hypothetical protein